REGGEHSTQVVLSRAVLRGEPSQVDVGTRVVLDHRHQAVERCDQGASFFFWRGEQAMGPPCPGDGQVRPIVGNGSDRSSILGMYSNIGSSQNGGGRSRSGALDLHRGRWLVWRACWSRWMSSRRR